MNKVELRELHDSDAERINNLAQDKRISDNLRDRFPHPYSIEDAYFFLNELVAKQNPRETFAISYNEELVGVIGIHPFSDIYRHSAEIGYWIGVNYWRKGIMSQAVPKILGYGFDQLNLHRIQAGVIAYNKGSMRVLEKSGMRLEGIHKEHAFKNGAFHDEHMYTMIR